MIINSRGKISELLVFMLDCLVFYELCYLIGDWQCFLLYIVVFLSCGCDVMCEMYVFVRQLYMYIFCIVRYCYSFMLD